MTTARSRVLRAHLRVAVAHLSEILLGQEAITRAAKILAYIGLTVDCGASADNSRAPLARWLVDQLNNTMEKPLEKISRDKSDGKTMWLRTRAPEVLPAFATTFNVDVVIVSSRKRPLVFGSLAPESDRPIIGIFHAIDSMTGVSEFHAIFVSKDGQDPRIPDKPRKRFDSV